jgi:CHAT domain-containing protein/tetratricopeptide (TPR) repeat protein
MRATFLLPLLLIPAPALLCAQSPFQFREAYLLEHRIQETRSGQEYDPNHSEQGLALEGPSQANQMVPDRGDILLYKSERWQDLLQETDRYRRMGGLELAEKQYLSMADKLRQAQGPASNDLALMLDHIGEFYLELRDFDKAHAEFLEALKVRQATIAALPPALTDANGHPAMPLAVYRLHLADLETRIGQMDLAKGDFASANLRLSDAVSIFNEKMFLPFVGGLYAVYFDSLLLEKQQKSQQAEELWNNAVALRQPFTVSDPYWNALKEQAAFYARHGDFHTAAQIAQKVHDATSGKTMRPEAAMPYLDSRPRSVQNQPQYSQYTLESNIAMSEILAMDKWRTDGAEAAAPLLTALVQRDNRDPLDLGSDAERTRLLAWFEQRAFLHMSILLDGDAPSDRIAKAYTTLAEVKGRYLATLTDDTRRWESERGNPGVDVKAFPILDQLGKAREQQARDFLSVALDGKPYSASQFTSDENKVRILSAALLSYSWGYNIFFNLDSLQKSVPTGSAYLDYVEWTRTDRDPKIAPHREYGVFVVRPDAPIRYFRIGEGDAIDSSIEAAQAGVVANRVRGFEVADEQKQVGPEELQKRLAALYGQILGPVESALRGAIRLFIVPDGKLAVAPFSALVDAQGHYVFENRTVTYLGSWRDLLTAESFGNVKSTTSTIAADPDFNLEFHGAIPIAAGSKRPQFKPLPGTEAEAVDVAKDLSIPQDHVLIGSAARKGIVESVQSPAVLHLATHSVPDLGWTAPQSQYSMFEFPQPTDTQLPLLQSVIAFTGANKPQQGTEDGLLTGLEVSSLHLPGTRLVVLSSCQSAQGSVVDGQGVLGFRAAFAMAGAQSIVMTLWPVDDQAGKQFMDFFYSHIDKGPSEAIRLAQKDMLATPNYKNPFFWSGYVVSESPDRQDQRATSFLPSRPAPASAPASATSSASAGPSDALVTPNCFEFHSTQKPGPGMINSTDIRVNIGGAVRRSQAAPGEVDFDLTPPGNELDMHSFLKVGTQVLQSPDVYVATRMHWAVDLIIDKDKDMSSLTLSFGRPGSNLADRRRIELVGPPNLFPSFAVPDQMPPVSAYTKATFNEGSESEAIDKIGICAAPPGS